MKRGTPQHPKVKTLSREIRMARFSAIGLLESLWHWTAEQCPEGDIGRFKDADIADGVDWPSERAAVEFTDALVAAGLVDRHPTKRLIVHDWSEHADRAVHQKLHRWGRNFADGYAPFERIKRGAKTEEKDAEHTKDVFEHSTSTQNEAPRTRAWPEPVSSIQCPEPEPEPPLPRATRAPAIAAAASIASAIRSATPAEPNPPHPKVLRRIAAAMGGMSPDALLSNLAQFQRQRSAPKHYGFWPEVIADWAKTNGEARPVCPKCRGDGVIYLPLPDDATVADIDAGKYKQTCTCKARGAAA